MRILTVIFALLFATPVSAADNFSLNVQTSTPAIGSIARGAQRVPVLQMLFSVACTSTPVAVSSVTIQHAGRGAASDIARVYLHQGNRRISRALTLPAKNDPITIAIPKSLFLHCSTVPLTLAADFSANADIGSEHMFRLVSVDANGAEVTYNMDDEGSLNIGASGTPASVTAELLPVTSTVRYGRNRTLARISLQGTGNKDQRIIAITLTNEGSATNSDLQNLYWATRTGEKVSEVIPEMQGRAIRIGFDPGLLLQGRDTKLIELRGDVRASRRRTIRLAIEEESDIEAMEVRIR